MVRVQMFFQEREWRAGLAQLMRAKPLVRAAIYVRMVTCGKPGCRCATGGRHRAFYLVCNVKGKRRQLFIPAGLEEEARQWVENYQTSMAPLEKLSERAWEELKQRKERKHS